MATVVIMLSIMSKRQHKARLQVTPNRNVTRSVWKAGLKVHVAQVQTDASQARALNDNCTLAIAPGRVSILILAGHHGHAKVVNKLGRVFMKMSPK